MYDSIHCNMSHKNQNTRRNCLVCLRSFFYIVWLVIITRTACPWKFSLIKTTVYMCDWYMLRQRFLWAKKYIFWLFIKYILKTYFMNNLNARACAYYTHSIHNFLVPKILQTCWLRSLVDSWATLKCMKSRSKHRWKRGRKKGIIQNTSSSDFRRWTIVV